MVKIEELNFWYKRKYPLFNNLNLTLETDNIYGLLGRNGAGKTTLLKIIAGTLFSKSGSCKLFDIESKKRNPDSLSKLFFVPEEFHLPSIPINEYVRLFAPFYSKFDKVLFTKMIDEFELSMDRKISSLSFGQKKKVLLGFGLATNCQLLILDEPTNGLDIPSKSQFRKLLTGAMNKERTFLVSTHQVRDMDKLIDPIIVLEAGKIIYNGSVESDIEVQFNNIISQKEGVHV